MDWIGSRHRRRFQCFRSRTSLLQALLGCALAVLIGISLTKADELPRLDRHNLLQYRDTAGKVQPVTTLEEWEVRRAEILRGMQQVMGKLPEHERSAPPEVMLLKEVDAGTYVRKLITYQSEHESRVPAYLCVPKEALQGSCKVPAVLCLHPSSKAGHKVALGLGGPAGRQYATELAQRGYVTLSPAYPQMANYWPNLPKLGYVSGTMKAIWDNVRGLDLLASMPYVDASRGFGAIGHSLGGHNAIYTAVFDDRITVLASSCGFDSYLDYYDGAERKWYVEKGWCKTRYMPRLTNYRGKLEAIPFDFHELLGAIAPRPIFVSAPLGDGNFRWKSVDECAAAAKPVFDLLGGREKLTVRHPDCKHSFPEEMRKEAYLTIDSVLHVESN